jgi:hypothetical protein
MPEPMNEPVADTPEVIAAIRKANAELTTKKHEQKSRITELEAALLAQTERADKAVATMRTAVIDLPLQRMAKQVSNTPELWLSELAKDYNFQPADDGSIVVQTKDGKEVKASDGKPLEWSHVGLYQLLAGKPHETATTRSVVYRQIMRYAGASGAATGNITKRKLPGKSSEEKEVALSFGLR